MLKLRWALWLWFVWSIVLTLFFWSTLDIRWVSYWWRTEYCWSSNWYSFSNCKINEYGRQISHCISCQLVGMILLFSFDAQMTWSLYVFKYVNDLNTLKEFFVKCNKTCFVVCNEYELLLNVSSYRDVIAAIHWSACK